MTIITWLLQTIVWIPARIGFWLFPRMRVYGREHLEGLKVPVIFASNHPSEVDPILLPTALHPFSPFFPTFYVARTTDEYLHLGTLKSFFYGGWFFKLWGAYPAYKGKHDYGYSLREHIRLLEKGKSVQFFPDGKMADETILFSDRPHGGVAYLSWKLGVPVVPLAIKGTHNTDVKDFFKFRRRYEITFGKPLYPRDLLGVQAESEEMPPVEMLRGATTKVLNAIREAHKG